MSRFIPVYTGNTALVAVYFNKMAVYPCVYREHAINEYVGQVKTGLSLCIQGTHHSAFAETARPRFIPVYTGNTNTLKYPLTRGWFIPVYTGNTVILYVILNKETVYPCVYREHPASS